MVNSLTPHQIPVVFVENNAEILKSKVTGETGPSGIEPSSTVFSENNTDALESKVKEVFNSKTDKSDPSGNIEPLLSAETAAKIQPKSIGSNQKYLVLSVIALAVLGGIASALYRNTSSTHFNSSAKHDENYNELQMEQYKEMQMEQEKAWAQARTNCKISLIETLSENTAGLMGAYCGGSKDYDPLKGRIFDFDKHIAKIESATESFPRSCRIDLTKEGAAFFAPSGDPKDFSFNVIPIKGKGGYFKTYISRSPQEG
jgi:hypothetical protein